MRKAVSFYYFTDEKKKLIKKNIYIYILPESVKCKQAKNAEKGRLKLPARMKIQRTLRFEWKGGVFFFPG